MSGIYALSPKLPNTFIGILYWRGFALQSAE